MNEYVVIKKNIDLKETWRYTANLLEEKQGAVLIEALFNRADLPFHGIVLREGDRFVEAYFEDRWFNIFQIRDRDSGQLKCWYCNVTLPATISGKRIEYVDLALDYLVFPDGRKLVLDEDEFAALAINEETQKYARVGLQELKDVFASAEGFLLEKEFASLVAGKNGKTESGE